jgi:transketolase
MPSDKEDMAQAYGEALVELGRRNPAVVVLDTDIADSCQTEGFKKAFPERSFDIGIAEQSLPTIGAGLALCGKIPICNSFAVFAVERGLDMIRQSMCYNRANVKIVGHSAGQSMGYTGPSHHTVEDVAALRALPNMAVLSPCDATEVRLMVAAMAEWKGPVYLRLPRVSVPAVHGPAYAFVFGKVDRLADGGDIVIFSSGDVARLALAARSELESRGISTRVVNVPCLKPLPEAEILTQAEGMRGAVTVEDHSVIGGLGSLVAEAFSRRSGPPLIRIGVQDRFTESDDCDKLREKYGISTPAIVAAAAELMEGRASSRA